MSMDNPDGKFVVVKDGQRVSGLHEDRKQADEEAAKLRNKLAEAKTNQPTPEVKVCQNICG